LLAAIRLKFSSGVCKQEATWGSLFQAETALVKKVRSLIEERLIAGMINRGKERKGKSI